MVDKEKFIKLKDFWDKALYLSESDKDEIKKNIKGDEFKDFAPSPKLYDSVSMLSNQSLVLDYGCGSGWASIILAKLGTKKIVGVDVSGSAIDALNFYKNVFNVEDIIEGIKIDSSWLKNEEDNKYDGFVCSNVLDVIPKEMMLDILKEIHRILSKDALMVIGLNYYLDPKVAQEKGLNLVSGNELYVDGVLRLVNYSSEELKEIFSEYFIIDSLTYFRWMGEDKDTRRLFILRNK